MTGRDPSCLLELAERCEQAAGPDRELDRGIELTLLGVLPHPDGQRFDNDLGHREPYVISGAGHPDYEPGQGYIPPRYTASLDAAMTLVPEGSHWGLGHDDTGPLLGWAWVRAKVSDGWQEFHSPPRMGFKFAGPFPQSPALALCAAALRARASNPTPPSDGDGK